MEVLNKVKNLKTADTKTFLSWEFNTLKDSKRDVTKLKNAIRKSGWSFPVIVWNNFVIDGAGRKKAVNTIHFITGRIWLLRKSIYPNR